MTGPCTSWVTAAEVAGRPDVSTATIDAGVLESACLDASRLLYVLSGRQYPGLCSTVLRPLNPDYGCRWAVSNLPDLLAAGATLDSWMAATNGGSCGCEAGIRLNPYPVRSITAVKIDGVTLLSSQYRLDDQRWLVRPGALLWPVWQRLDLPDTAVGTFSVAITYGAAPPSTGVSAASTLAAEFAKLRAGLPNRLPQRVTNITRQGVSMTLLDPLTSIKDGFTGLYDVDLFLRSENPGKQTRRPTVWSPDTTRNRRM